MPVCRFCDCKAAVGARSCPSCGAELPILVADVDAARLEAEIRGMIHRGDAAGAIEFYCDTTGATFTEARAAIERLKVTAAQPRRDRPRHNQPLATEDGEPRVDAALVREILALLARGQKVQAITTCSIRACVGVEEAKEIVEALAAARPRARRRIGIGGMVLIGWAVLGFLASLLS